MSKRKSVIIPPVGQRWPGSKDIRIAECWGENGPNYHLLLVCDAEGKPVVLKPQEWGPFGRTVNSTDSHRDGLANTEAMLAAGLPLAKAVRKRGKDCYLPAICELQAIRANCPVELAEEWFWSSSQYSDDIAWGQEFGCGDTTTWGKTSDGWAFVVRRIPIQS